MNDFRHRYWNDSVFVVDFGGIDVPSKSTQTVAGIYDLVGKAYESGKPVLFTGVNDYSRFFSTVRKMGDYFHVWCGQYFLVIGTNDGISVNS